MSAASSERRTAEAKPIRMIAASRMPLAVVRLMTSEDLADLLGPDLAEAGSLPDPDAVEASR